MTVRVVEMGRCDGEGGKGGCDEGGGDGRM